MRWADLHPGLFVRGTAEDFFQAYDGTAEEIANTEYLFDFEGRIESVTQRKVVIDGWWIWIGNEESCTEDDPVETRGRFGIIRKGIDSLEVLSGGLIVDL